MIEVKNLWAGYPGKPVLQDLNLTIPEGKVTVVLGPNGCGKSTLLKALCGILPVEKGGVMLGGEDILALPQRLLARKAAYLSQGRQIPDITVERLVLHGRFPYLSFPRRYGKEDEAVARAAMEAMGITDLAETPLRNLSGGERQKVYIAMALAQDTPVILLDEPTTYLDVGHQLQIMEQARQLTQQGKTVVMVLHDLPHAFGIGDHMVLMDGGNIVAAGTPEEMYASGWIDRVFRVRLGRTMTDGRWRYFTESVNYGL